MPSKIAITPIRLTEDEREMLRFVTFHRKDSSMTKCVAGLIRDEHARLEKAEARKAARKKARAG